MPIREKSQPIIRRVPPSLLLLWFLQVVCTLYPGFVFGQSFRVQVVDDRQFSYSGSVSVAVAQDGTPHLLYPDGRHVWREGSSWLSETVAPGIVGDQPRCLSIDPSGSIAALLYTPTPNSFPRLLYALKGDAGWTVETADTLFTYTGAPLKALSLDRFGTPHIVSSFYANPYVMQYTTKALGQWITEPLSVGPLASACAIASDSLGYPHVLYLRYDTSELVYTTKQSGIWQSETVDISTGLYAQPALSQPLSIALDSVGNPHISYFYADGADLKYAHRNLGTWTIEYVDTRLYVGGSNSIAIDAFDNPHIAYTQGTQSIPPSTRSGVRYAWKNGGFWVGGQIDSVLSGACDLALDEQGNARVAYTTFAYDAYTPGWYPAGIRYASGGISTTELSVVHPSGGASWFVGAVDSVVWSGPGPVDVFLALDGGFNWTLLRERVEESPLTLQVPHVPTRFAKIRLVSSLGEEPAAESDSFFVIRSEVSLSKFVAANSDEGVELAWETDPMPPAIAGYRVERAIGGGAYAALHAGLLGGGGFTDRSRSSGARYRLIAINGLGEEYVLGETSVAGALAADRDIIAYPNPASGPMEILYRVPFDRPIDLTIYDLSGRRVRSLVAGRQPVGVQSATWDRRDEAGRDVAAGPYFARLTSGDGFTATERITIVR